MNEVDEHLLSLIRAGDQEGWRQFVSRYQGRLSAFAENQVRPLAAAEDLVQETFIGFLGSLANYQTHCELESFLFQILRRRIIDHYRRQGKSREIPACQFSSEPSLDPISQTLDPSADASEAIKHSEQREALTNALTSSLRILAGRLQSGNRFRDLKIAEGLFYAGARNRDLAQAIKVGENEIAVVKRRLVSQLANEVRGLLNEVDDVHVPSDLLTEVWELQRPSCPKRSTLGKYSLGILPHEWEDYVEFHVDVLGCNFCKANLSELALQVSAESTSRQDRLFQSTIGFFRAT